MQHAWPPVLGRALSALVVVLLLPAQPDPRAASPGPGSVTRLRLIVTSAAPIVEVGLDAGLVLHDRSRVAAGDASATVDAESRTCRLENRRVGTDVEAEAEFVLIVAGLGDNPSMRWHVRMPAGGSAVAEMYNANEPERPRLIERVESQGSGTTVATSTSALVEGAAAASATVPPLVVAAYYPWYIHQTWDSPKLLDHPLHRYSVEQLDEMVPVFQQAMSAGIDALAVSWQGRDHRVSVAFQTASATGMAMTILMETLAATASHQSTAVDPDTVVAWIDEIVDVYGSRPTYLRLGDRPVIFVYAVDSLPPGRWADVIGLVRGSGRNPVLIADSSNPAYLESFDGEFNYSTIGLPAGEYADFDRRTVLATRTFSLLHGGPTRIAVSTVSPGYDDTRLHDRPVHRVVDRAGGSVYERQWRAAVDSRPDWVFVTSWNEWYENTEIEPSVLYGDASLRATARWTTQFGCAAPPGVGRSGLLLPGTGTRCR